MHRTVLKSYTPTLILIVILLVEVLVFSFMAGWPVSFAFPKKNPNSLQTRDHPEERQYWAERIDSIGAEAAYGEFKKVYENKSFGIQHTMAHLFGELLYKKENIRGVAVCDSTFAFGCYHSFFGTAIANEGIGIIQQMDQECIKKWGLKGLGCPHGIGHGVLSYYGEENLLEALEKCKTLSWQDPIGGCTSGVFMEYNFRTMEDPNGQQLRPLDKGNPHYPCTKMPDKFLQACYWDLPQWWEQVFNNDYSKIGTLCNEVKDTLAREACYRGLGNAIAPSTGYNIEKTISDCHVMPSSEAEELCREGASWSFYAEPKVRANAPKLCEFKNVEMSKKCNRDSDIFDDVP